jgi:thioredoxin reductase/multisubunit Na+/H+ antiporter MnhG subunit
MSWLVLSGLVIALGLAFLATLARRNELVRMRRGLEQRALSDRASADTVLRHPVVDLSRCLGCGTCIASCPEGDVLALVHGQATVVNGARCVGHAACERECPVGAITVTVANLSERRDVPVVTEALESVSAPGLFLAGEVTAHALVKVAIEQGVAAVGEVARRLQHSGATPGEHELCIVGAGPAGLAAALEARRLGLGFVVLEQEPGPGGTVARYPRRKLVLTQPLALPLHGLLGGGRTEFTKEELVALWLRLAREHDLPIHGGVAYHGCERTAHGGFVVSTSAGDVRARHVLLALGRRGSPRKLGVPGEDLPKAAYALLDARSYAHRRVLVVGGGDAAAETALALAEQPGNHVVLSYRREAFFRVRPRNIERLDAAAAEGRLVLALRSELREITPDAVVLELERDGIRRRERLANDEVFVLAGGTAPLERLERSGVSCDPGLRAAPPAPVIEQGTGLVPALGVGFALALGALLFAAWNADYYLLPLEARPAAAKHGTLRPGSGTGLAFGIAATALVALNLAYLGRRAGWRFLSFGSLRAWMTSHVTSGLLALVFAVLHGAMDPRDTVGGHALLALVLLFVTGAVGRYFYAWIPRAANGRELELAEVRRELDGLAQRWEGGRRELAERVRAALEADVAERQWSGSFLGRVAAVVGGHRALGKRLASIAAEGRASGVPAEELAALLALARTAHRTSTAAAHLEDLRALLATWRWLHRWVALLLVVLVGLHVLYALTYGSLLRGGAP